MLHLLWRDIPNNIPHYPLKRLYSEKAYHPAFHIMIWQIKLKVKRASYFFSFGMIYS
jgi:hypothetical protein